jgi:hypothetical protein
MKLIVLLCAVLLVVAVLAVCIFLGSQSGGVPTEPSASAPVQTDDPSGDTDPSANTDPLPSGDVGVGIWEDETDPSDETDPTQSDATGDTTPTESNPTQSDPTGPSGSTDVDIWGEDPTTQPTESTTQPTAPVEIPSDGELTWEQYLALTSEQRYEYYKTFESMDAFFAWKNAAEAEYDATHTIPTIDGNIDLGDLIGGNG